MKILSGRRSCILEAIRRIRTTLCEIEMRSAKPARLYLMEPLDAQAGSGGVNLIPWKQLPFFPVPRNQLNTAGPVVPCLASSASEQKTMSETSSMVSDRLGLAIASALQSLRLYRGFIQARVRFGVLYLTSYERKPPGTNHSLEEFCAMMEHSQVMAELGPKSTLISSLLQRSMADLASVTT